MRPEPDFQTSGSFAATAAHPSSDDPPSAWHSTVPYLFGGLAAMLGLLAFSLLVVACSYWRVSGCIESGDDSDHSDNTDDGVKPGYGAVKPPPQFFEERIVVIMAGDSKPTFLATPIASRIASLADKIDDTDATNSDEVDGKKSPEGAVTSSVA